MKYLLDTHTFLWWTIDSHKLSTNAAKIIRNPRNDCFISLASCWELAIKSSIGKLSLSLPVEQFISGELKENNFKILHITLKHIGITESLPYFHRDPFDRLLAAQSMADQMPLLSADSALDHYDIKRIW